MVDSHQSDKMRAKISTKESETEEELRKPKPIEEMRIAE